MKKSHYTDGERIKEVMKWAGFDKVSAFRKTLGYDRGEKISRIIRGLNGISKSVANDIVKRYPQINIKWLLGEEEDMLQTEKDKCPDCEKKDRFIESLERQIGRLEKELAKYEGRAGEEPKRKVV